MASAGKRDHNREDREKKLAEIAAEVEHSLEPAGITAIEAHTAPLIPG